MSEKPKTFENKSQFMMYGCLCGAIYRLWKNRQYKEIKNIALKEAALGWDAGYARAVEATRQEMQAEIDKLKEKLTLEVRVSLTNLKAAMELGDELEATRSEMQAEIDKRDAIKIYSILYETYKG